MQLKSSERVDSEEVETDRNDFKISFLPMNHEIAKSQNMSNKGHTEHNRSFGQHSGEDTLDNLADDDDEDSVYEHTYQKISEKLHPLLRAAKLTKRIRKDKRITMQQRKALKARRNIIMFRIRQKRFQAEDEL